MPTPRRARTYEPQRPRHVTLSLAPPTPATPKMARSALGSLRLCPRDLALSALNPRPPHFVEPLATRAAAKCSLLAVRIDHRSPQPVSAHITFLDSLGVYHALSHHTHAGPSAQVRLSRSSTESPHACASRSPPVGTNPTYPPAPTPKPSQRQMIQRPRPSQMRLAAGTGGALPRLA